MTASVASPMRSSVRDNVAAAVSAAPVSGSRPWKCTTAAPASTHAAASAAISSGLQGTSGLAPRMANSLSRTVMATPSIAPPSFAPPDIATP